MVSLKYALVCSRLVFGVAMALVCLFTSHALAQRPRQTPVPISSEVALMPAPREVQVLLDDAQEAIEKKQWSEATLSLGLLLGIEEGGQEDVAGQDYFLIDDDEGGILNRNPSRESPKETVFGKVYKLIASLPAEATKVIELRYGVLASQKLDKAIEQDDWTAIEEIAGRYSFTTAGQDAGVLVAQHWLRKGELLRAARHLDRVASQASALERLGPQIGVLDAAIHQVAAKNLEAQQAIDATRQVFPKASFDWKGTKIGWNAPAVASQDLLESLKLSGQSAFLRVLKQPYYLGGNSRRNADTSAGVPLPILRWHAELHESKQHKENLERTIKEKANDSKVTWMPSRTPISVGPWVIVSTYDQRIVAVDMLTGLLAWEYPFSGMPLGMSMDRFTGKDSHSMNLVAPDYLVRRVWGEAILGNISSDGERVYCVSELPVVDVAESFALGLNARVSKPQGLRTYNVLQCCSVREEGKIKWEVGGQKSPLEPALAGALFLGAPLPHDGQLLVMAELNSDIYLFALAPETGKLLWNQPIATNSATVAMDQLRRNVGAMPSADGQIIVCPTVSGTVVALDSSSKSLLWAFQYPMRSNLGTASQVGVFGQTMDYGDYAPLMPRSADLAPVISNGAVIFAPPDGNELYAINLADGKLLWQLGDGTAEQGQPDQVCYVAGAWNDTVFIANLNSFSAFDIRTGEEKWPSIKLPTPTQVVGRGGRKEGMYLLPTSNQELLQIDLKTGAILEKALVEQPLGNLISVGERIVSASPFQLDCYTVREASQSQLRTELQQNAISIRGLIDQSELALANKDFDAAIKAIDEASKLDTKSAEVILLKNKISMAALNHDFDKYVDRVNLSKNLAFDRDRLPYLRLVVKGLQRQGRYQMALEKAFELSELRAAQRQEQMSGSDVVSLNQRWTIQEDRWIATQFQNIVAKLNPEEMAAMKPTILEEFRTLGRLPSNVRRMKLEHFQALPGIEGMWIESAVDLIQIQDFLQAERILQADFLQSLPPGSPIERRRRELLANVYVRLNRLELATRYLDSEDQLEELIRGVTDRSIVGMPSPTEIIKPQKRARKPYSEWPTGKLQVTASQLEAPPANFTGFLDSRSACRWKSIVGEAMNGWSVHLTDQVLVISNPITNERFESFLDVGIQEKQTIPNVFAVDSVIVLELNRQLIAINTLNSAFQESDNVLWRQQIDAELPEFDRGRGRATQERNTWGLTVPKGSFRVVAANRSGIIIVNDDVLSCLDIKTGNTIWSWTGFKDCHFAFDRGKLLAYHPRNQTFTHLDPNDGAVLDEKPIDLSNWTIMQSVGHYWLMTQAGSKNHELRVANAIDGEKIFEKTFSSDTKLALDGDVGVVALRASGELTYWNLETKKEYVHQLDRLNKFMILSTQRFQDTLLVMSYGPAMDLPDVGAYPRFDDPSFAPLAGQMLALSVSTGEMLWKEPITARQFYFPIAQDRDCPLAIFVRRLDLKVEGQKRELASVTLIDVRDGRVMFERDDLPAIRGLGFTQIVRPDQNQVTFEYLGNRIDAVWTNEEYAYEKPKELGYITHKELLSKVKKQMLDAAASDSGSDDEK